jgi:LacI family transcriptional regulator
MVQFDRVYDDIDTPKIITDDYQSSFIATEHLIEQGCKRIGYLVVKNDLSIGKTRERGYIDALEKHNIKYDEKLVVDCSNSYEENDPIIKTALTKLNLDGVFASVERLAFATYYACYDLNINIPSDLKVISFSSLEIAPLLNPSLTTITQPAIEIGNLAAKMLFNILLENSKDLLSKNSVVLTSKIIHRNSTKRA